MALYLLFEAASGYALFEVEGMDELAQGTDALQQVSLVMETGRAGNSQRAGWPLQHRGLACLASSCALSGCSAWSAVLLDEAGGIIGDVPMLRQSSDASGPVGWLVYPVKCSTEAV